MTEVIKCKDAYLSSVVSQTNYCALNTSNLNILLRVQILSSIFRLIRNFLGYRLSSAHIQKIYESW